MTNIYGSVGYTMLKNKYNKILVMADVHSKLSYCDNKIDVSDWFKENMNIKNILLEEVPRNGVELNELFKESEHTQKLKNLFLQNSHLIHGIDIRPYLIPFSWEMCNLQEENKSCEFTLRKYLENLDTFFDFRDKYIQQQLERVYTSNYLKSEHLLGKHYIELYELFKAYKENNKKYMEIQIINIDRRILEEFNNILDGIMEWYTLAKMFQLRYNKQNVIIHTGLYHSKNIIDKLIESYDYSIIDINGINSIEEIAKYDNYSGCVSLSEWSKKQLSSINKY
jgi:hypothetical protein